MGRELLGGECLAKSRIITEAPACQMHVKSVSTSSVRVRSSDDYKLKEQLHKYDLIGVTNPTGLSSGSLGFSLLTEVNAITCVPPAFWSPSQESSGWPPSERRPSTVNGIGAIRHPTGRVGYEA